MIKSIRGKITVWCILIVGTLNIILSIFIYDTINSKLEKNIADNMQNVRYMAKNMAMVGVNINGDKDNLINNSKSIVDELYKYYGSYINITLKDSNEFTRGNIILPPESITNIILESQNIKSLLKLSKIENSYIATYNYPIYIEDNYLGNLVVQKDYTLEYNENNQIMTTIFLGQILLLLILIIALWIVIGRITKPIKKLSSAIDSFGHGQDNDDIEVVSQDEVGILTHNFNTMKNQINEQIEEIIREQSRSREFFNNATHELKTPITAISGYAQILLDEDIENMDVEFRDRALMRMVKESEKLNNLLKNILEISRGQVNVKYQKEKFDIGELIENKINEMQVRLIKSNLTIIKDIESVEVYLIKEDISTIISNLIDNAIKYTCGDTISIELKAIGRVVEFKITNKIYDLPENIKDRLLDAFVKHSDDEILQREKITSSGLGLYICSELAKKNDLELLYDLECGTITFKLSEK